MKFKIKVKSMLMISIGHPGAAKSEGEERAGIKSLSLWTFLALIGLSNAKAFPTVHVCLLC